MSKIVFRYFYDFLEKQENWLNNMAKLGYRLKKCGKMFYFFDECQPNEYEYAIEYVGNISYGKAKEYRSYLDDMGYRTFTKNINLNFSYGKVRWRPYAKGLGQIATSPGGFNKELLILEKKRDGQPFELHTDVSDKCDTYKAVRQSYRWAVLILLLLTVMTFIPGVSSLNTAMIWTFRVLLILISILFLLPAVKYSSLIKHLKDESKIYE